MIKKKATMMMEARRIEILSSVVEAVVVVFLPGAKSLVFQFWLIAGAAVPVILPCLSARHP
jgi:hypothetical protein